MKSPTLEDRRQLWKLAYARASFTDAKMFANMLLNLTINDRNLYKGLTISMSVTYSRPFKQRNSVKLKDDIIPERYLDVHRSIIEHRDKVIAHRDIDGPFAEWGFPSELVLDVKDGQVGLETLSPMVTHQMAKDLIDLTDELIDRMDGSINEIINKIGPHIPGPGKFVLNLTDSGSWIERRA